MFASKNKIAENVDLVVDHLEAALKIGEELASQSFNAAGHNFDTEAGNSDPILAQLERQTAFVDRLYQLEMSFMVKIRQARHWAERLARYDSRTRQIVALFSLVTQPIVDAMAEISNQQEADFQQAGQAFAYLSNHGLMGGSNITLDSFGTERVGGGFLICGVVALADIMDLSDTFITTLDIHYRLYESTDITPDNEDDDTVSHDPESEDDTVGGAPEMGFLAATLHKQDEPEVAVQPSQPLAQTDVERVTEDIDDKDATSDTDVSLGASASVVAHGIRTVDFNSDDDDEAPSAETSDSDNPDDEISAAGIDDDDGDNTGDHADTGTSDTDGTDDEAGDEAETRAGADRSPSPPASRGRKGLMDRLHSVF